MDSSRIPASAKPSCLDLRGEISESVGTFSSLLGGRKMFLLLFYVLPSFLNHEFPNMGGSDNQVEVGWRGDLAAFLRIRHLEHAIRTLYVF